MSSPALLLLGLAVTVSARSASAASTAGPADHLGAAGGPVLAPCSTAAAAGRILGATLAGYAAGLAVITVALGAVPVAVVVGVAVLAGFLARP